MIQARTVREWKREKLSANHPVWNTLTGERLGLGIRNMTDAIDLDAPGHDAEDPAAP